MKRHQILVALTAISLLLCGCQKSADIDQMAPSQPEETLASEVLSLAQEEPLTAIVRHENMPGMEELPGYADIIPDQDGFFAFLTMTFFLAKQNPFITSTKISQIQTKQFWNSLHPMTDITTLDQLRQRFLMMDYVP